MFRPKTWLIAYWTFAFVVWILFLAICFLKINSNRSGGNANNLADNFKDAKTKSASTEDLWHEDHYLPSPDYLVSINAVQPFFEGIEDKKEFDETWDYNYEEQVKSRKLSEPSELYKAAHSDFSTDDEGDAKTRLLSSSSPSGRRFVSSRRPTRPLSHYSMTSTSSAPPFHGGGPGRFHPSLGSRRRPSPPFSAPRHIRPLRYGSGSTLAASRHPLQPPLRMSSWELPSRPHAPSCPRSGASSRHIPPPPESKRSLITASKTASASSISDEELRSLRDVCEGRVQRKDSLVTDAKFDSLLSSLQSLASDLERDFLSDAAEAALESAKEDQN